MLLRTLSEKDSASLKLAEAVNSSQDGSPTSQACGVLGIHPAVSFCQAASIAQVWEERESVAALTLQPSQRPIKHVWHWGHPTQKGRGTEIVERELKGSLGFTTT